MMQVIREIWAEAMRPEDHAGQVYGGAQHQLAKTGLAVFVTAVLACGFAAVAGEMPFRGPLWFGLVYFYVGVIELRGQGSRGWDTVADSYFWAYGVTIPLVSLREVSAGRVITLQLDTWAFLALAGGLVVSLLIYAWTRRTKEDPR
jgi:hypothetical protein